MFTQPRTHTREFISLRRERVEARVHGNVKAYNFHGTTRACNVGENANETSPCFKNNCALCSIMRTSFQKKFAGNLNPWGPLHCRIGTHVLR